MPKSHLNVWSRLLFLLLFLAAADPVAANHLTAEDLQGPVRSVIEERLLLLPDGQTASAEILQQTTYDREGYITQIIWYDKQEVYREKNFRYDTAHRLTATGTHRDKHKFQADIVYHYDPLGRLERISYIAPDNFVYMTKVNRYDPAGRLSVQLRLDAEDRLQGSDVFSYQSDGKLSATQHYDSHHTLITREIYEYGQADSNTRESVYADGPLPLKTIWYDEAGRKTAEINYTGDGSIHRKFVCEYSPSGKKIKQIHYRGDGTKFAETLYNELGLPKTYLNYHADGTAECSEEYSYHYDQRGNWIEKTIATCPDEPAQQPAHPLERLRRTIRYYE